MKERSLHQRYYKLVNWLYRPGDSHNFTLHVFMLKQVCRLTEHHLILCSLRLRHTYAGSVPPVSCAARQGSKSWVRIESFLSRLGAVKLGGGLLTLMNCTPRHILLSSIYKAM